jgi:hypothetical protein
MSPFNLQRWICLLPVPVQPAVKVLISFLVGAATALVIYYVFYRVELPSKPFIYVAF